jgi:hypothetical protein
VLRCSVNSIFRHGVEVAEVAEQEIPRLAREANATCERSGAKFMVRTESPSSEDPKSTIYSWYVGLGGHVAVISVFVDHRFGKDKMTERVLACAELLARTFRRVEIA